MKPIDGSRGVSFGPARLAWTAKCGPVVILSAGVDSSGGHGDRHFVNPKAGTTLETLQAGSVCSAVARAGLTYAERNGSDLSGGPLDSV